MKKFILFLIAIFCINSFVSTIEAKPNSYKQYRKTIKCNAKRSFRKFHKHRRGKNYGRFKSKFTNKTYKGHKPLYVHQKCKFAKRNPPR